MRAFKGFNKDLTCRGYQYEEGKEFHTERAECCDTGFHACEYPLDCFGYYDPAHSDGDYMDPYDKESWELTGAKMVVVDGEKIKEDTYYRCIEGEIVEVTEDGEIVEE